MKWLRVVTGVLLILHGLAHASAGMWATDTGGHMLVTFLWQGATLGFMAAGAGLIGIGMLHRRWRLFITIAAVCSLTLLLLYGHPLFIVGIAADFAAIGLAIATTQISIKHDVATQTGRTLRYCLIALIAYTGVVIGLRPWHSSWGSTRSERQMVMIGDPPLGESHYRIDHAVTINAPVDSVWRLVEQIGQERGWRVRQIETGRAMVIENWGAFALEPISAAVTRMHIRRRGAGVPTVSGIALTPAALLVFEPAHFIMERGMLLGIKQRAESAWLPRIQVAAQDVGISLTHQP